MGQKLTPDELAAAASAAGYDPRAVRAVLQVETGGSGYDKTTGYLLIQFEPSWFRRLLSKAAQQLINAALAVQKLDPQKLSAVQKQTLADWAITQNNGVEGQLRERMAFDAATRLDAHAALMATSWGLPQCMGFNHAACGYQTVEAMVEAFRVSEANQVAGMLKFIKANSKMSTALKTKDWGVFAYYYNGAGYKAFNYDKRLAMAYASLT